MEHARLHSNVHVETARHFCPACFFPVESNSMELLDGSVLHVDPCCVTRWARMSLDTQVSRLAEARRLSDPSSWEDAPDATGPYWARRVGCGVVIPVNILKGIQGFVVKCGDSTSLLGDYMSHKFMKKAA